jgi:hypothetical protein
MVTVILLMVSCPLALLTIGSQFLHLSSLWAIESYSFALYPGDLAAPAVDWSGVTRQTALVSIEVVHMVVTGVVFLMWIHRAYRNLRWLNPTRHYPVSPAKVVMGFFVPVVNLYSPPMVLCELWTGSSDSRAEAADSPVLPIYWWAMFIASWTVAAFGSFHYALGVREEIQQVWWSILSQSLWIAAAVFGIMVIRRIDRMQTEKSLTIGDVQVIPAAVADAT